MSTLTKVLEKNVAEIEKNADMTEGRFRLGHHLMPPMGWLNDPNGLCWYKGRYHVFFQYAPFDVEGGLKFWGHYTSEDLVDWKYEGTALYPDSPYDCHGVYSGSAFTEHGKMHLFFTGNVKIDGDYDYINEGRETSTLHVESEDGIHFHKYEGNPVISEPPEDNTYHFRDPKVWREDDHFKMIIGGQKEDGRGHVLIYQSDDLINWDYLGEYGHASTIDHEGKMWECPDLFRLNGVNVLLMSPQGIKEDGEKYRNYHQTGYKIKDTFIELDHGHDFYAATTMLAPDGRRILMAWMDMWHSEFPEKEEGWSGAMTFPRELTIHDDHLYMMPVEELALLRCESKKVEVTDYLLPSRQVEIDLDICDGLSLNLSNLYTLTVNNHKVTVMNQTERVGTIKEYQSMKLLIDSSSVEVFINGGELVFTDRVYFKDTPVLSLNKKMTCRITTLSE